MQARWGFASDLRPWTKKLIDARIKIKGLRSLFVGAWDVSVGALLFQHEMLRKSYHYYRTVNYARRSLRRDTWDFLRRTVRGRKSGSYAPLITRCVDEMRHMGLGLTLDPYELRPHRAGVNTPGS